MKVIDRYILRELLLPYIGGMGGFIVVLSIDPLTSAMRNLINQNVPFEVVSKWFIFSLTEDMIFTFPMAMLLATLLTFGRLTKDSEIIAMKAGGISFARLGVPVAIFALLTTVAAWLFGEFIMPETTREAETLKREKILRLLPSVGAENVFIKVSPDITMYVERVDTRTHSLTNVVVTYYDPRTDRVTRRIFAPAARRVKDTWVFLRPVEFDYTADPQNPKRKATLHSVNATDIRVETKDLKQPEQRYNIMSMRELRERIRYVHDHGLSDVNPLLVEFYMKTSIPFSCFIFALIGMGMGSGSSRTGAFIGFGISIIVIFIYYVVMSICKSYGKNGILPPLLAAWLQNIVFTVAGIYLVAQVKT